MATITRENLKNAIGSTSIEFVSEEAYDKLKAWAYNATEFTVGDWDDCPLDQVGLVKAFETRGRYEYEEDIRFANQASELDAHILEKVQCNYAGQLDGGLKVYVTG